jgi:transposase
MGRQNRFSAEVRERAMRLVREHEHEYGSRWAAIESIAPKIGCTPQTLHTWVRKSEPAQVVAATEQARIKQLEREVTELRRANEILRKASAFFAQAELDRRGKS